MMMAKEQSRWYELYFQWFFCCLELMHYISLAVSTTASFWPFATLCNLLTACSMWMALTF